MSLFNYFCHEKNLHNLLWVYAPYESAYYVTMYYPGDDYVDIVALDVYVDDPVFSSHFLFLL
jgi:mannan endo-1,4-beta-mannosidase